MKGVDPQRAADDAAVGNLLRCWVRETAIAEPGDGTLRLELKTARMRIHAPVKYWSPVGWHRFGPARLVDPQAPGRGGDDADAGDLADPATLAALLAIEAASGGRPDAVADLVARVTDSAANTARFYAHRLTSPHGPIGTTPFLNSEQALILGHPLHPTPKSRDELTEAQLRAYSPELRGSFALHWFAADESIVAGDSALPESAQSIIGRLARPQLPVPTGMVAIPAHPWQARELLGRPAIQQLLASGLLRELGPAGPLWHPTSSLRTVYRADSPVMLKLSLGMRITNSRRENLRKELRRGVEVHRMLKAGLGAELKAAHPGFEIVRDPAWLAVDLSDAPEPDSGLDVAVRENPFGAQDLAHCVAGLVAERPGADPSLLACLVKGLAVRSRRPVREVAREWFGRYLDAVAVPVLWLYAEHGIALEAHQQNTLVVVNAGGWPVGGRYRDNQGYYFAASRAAQLERWAARAGEAGESIVADEVVDERLGYYLGVNNLMGLIGAFGSQGLADERTLLADLRAALERFAARDGRVPAVVTALLDSGTLRCKANLLTRVGGLDELVEPLARQSVYVEIPNPIAQLGR
jgi:siderophore synthetase component